MAETEREAQAMADAAADAAVDVDEDEDESEASEGRKQQGIYISLTQDDLRGALEAKAQEAGQSPRVYVLGLIAQATGVTVAAPRSRQKYASDEERKAAQEAKRKDRNDLIKQLLAEHRAKQLAEAGEGAVVEVEA